MQATPGAKMMYLIKRKATTSREELVAHWFANHMPIVIQRQLLAASAAKPHAHKYIATLFDANASGEHPWDGVAQLWFDAPFPKPRVPTGTKPTDTFQQKAEPYTSWATREYIVLDGAEHLSVEPLTLNAPFPTTRSGFFKVTFLVAAKPNIDCDAFFAHWLEVHVPNVKATMERAAGFRYVVSHSLASSEESYAGMAELYFHDQQGWDTYRKTIRPDGMEQWADRERTLVLRAHTELVGIP